MTNNVKKSCGMCCEYFNKIDLITDYSRGGESHICIKCAEEFDERQRKFDEKVRRLSLLEAICSLCSGGTGNIVCNECVEKVWLKLSVSKSSS
jgi:hypothetical protein